jgi:hypothetical protein
MKRLTVKEIAGMICAFCMVRFYHKERKKQEKQTKINIKIKLLKIYGQKQTNSIYCK